MHRFILIAALILPLTSLAAAPPWILKDLLGNPMVKVENVQFGPRDFLGSKVTFTATNISGLPISHVFVNAKIRFSTITAPRSVLLSPGKEALFPGEATVLDGRILLYPVDQHPAVEAIDLELDYTFKSPQQLEQAKKDEAAAAKSQRESVAACAALYSRTIDKPARDLTVREETNIRYCRSRDWYRPE